MGYGSSTTAVNNIFINGGALNFTGTNGGGGTAASNITMTGGTISGTPFDWYISVTGGVNSFDPTLATLASSTTATISSGMNLRLSSIGILTLNVAQGSVPSNGPDLLISGPVVVNTLESVFGGGITKTGLGTAELSSTGNTYTGATIVDAGTLILDHINTNANTTIVNGGTLVLRSTNGSTGIINGSLTINSGGTVNADADWSLGYLNGSGSFCVSTIAINGGTLNFTGAGNNGGTSANITMTGGTISNSGTIGHAFDWYSGITTSPTLNTLANSTTATVSSGINLRLGTTHSLTLNVAAGTVPSGVDLLVSGNVTAGGEGGGITKMGTGTAELSGTGNTYNGGTTVDAGTLILDQINSANSSTIVNGGTLKLAATNGSIGIINGSLTINSGGTVSASTNWSLGYGTPTTDVTSIAINGGTLNFVLTPLGTGGGTAANSITMTGGTISGAPFDWYYNSFGAVATLNTVASSTPAIISSGFNVRVGTGADITLNVAAGTVPTGADLLISGNIAPGSGGGGITMTGAGTAVLSGVNTYTGGTIVNQGTLIMTSPSNNLAGGGLTITGGTFAYEPTAAGQLPLGAGIVTLANGSTLGAALGGTSSQSAITSSATASVAGTVTVNVYGVPNASVSSGSYNLLTAGGGLTTGSPIYTLGNIYNATNFTVTPGSLTATSTALSVGVTQQNSGLSLSNEYWIGGYSGGANVWALSDGTATSNWASNSDGTGITSLVPGTNTTVTLSATGATNQGSMTLGASMSIAGLVVNDTTPMVLGGSNLTIGSGGITINNASGNPNLTLAANLTLGAAQIWQNTSSNPLLVSGNVTNGGNLLTVQGSGNTTIGGIIGSGAGGLTQAGSGTLILTAANAYTGATTITSGTLQLGNGGTTGSLATSSSIADNGTFVVDRSNAVVQGTDFTATAINGGGALMQIGAGTLTLNAPNAYTGVTTVTAGKLTLSGAGTFGNGSLLTVSGGTADLAGVSLANSAAVNGISDGGSSSGTITSSSGTPTLTVNITGGGNQTYGGILSGSLALAVNSTGSGAQTLGDANTYSGGTTIGGGVLRVANATGTSATGTGTVTVNSGGTLAGSLSPSQGFITGAVTVNSGGTISASNANTLTLSGGLTLGAGTTTSTFDLTGTPSAHALIATTGGAGGKSLVVSGTDAIATSGTPAAGTYDLISFTGTAPTAGSFTVPAAPTGFVYGINITSAQVDLIVASSITWTDNSLSDNWNTTTTNNWAVGNLNATYVDGEPVLFNNSNATGGTAPTGTVVVQAGGVAPLSVVFGNSGVGYALSNFAADTNGIKGATTVAIQGGGMVTFNSPNTYTGTTTISNGTLRLADPNAVQNSTVSVGASGSLTFKSGLGNANLGGLAGSGNITLADAGSAPITINVGGNGASTAYSGSLGGSGSLNLVGGTLSLSGANGYSGGTTIQNGTLQAGADNPLPTAGTLTFNAASATGTLDLNGHSVTVGGLAIASGASSNAINQIITNSNASATGTLVYNGGTSSFGGVLQDGGSGKTLALTVAGGALTLSGSNNTYTGTTNVNGGTLRVSNTLPASSATGGGSVNVNSTGTLTGSGFIGGTVTVGANATVAPSLAGTSSAGTVTTLSVGGLTLGDGSQLDYQVSSVSSLDSIVIPGSGILTFPGAGSAVFNFYAPGAGATPYIFGAGTYPLISYGSLSMTNSLNSSLMINVGNNSWPVGDSATFSTTTASGPGVLELVISQNVGSATWSSGGDSSYGNSANWREGVVPNGAGFVATFGAGSETSVSIASGYTIGQLNFNNGGNSGAPIDYTLSGSGSLTLNNSGNGASVNVSSGGLIPALGGSLTLTLADSSLTTTFNIASDGSLDVAGPINQSGGAQQIVLTGGGTLSLDNATNTYSGGTTVNSGTLVLDAGSSSATTIGSGPLAINGPSSNVTVSSAGLTVGSLSGSGGGQLNVAPSTTLTVNQSTSSTFNGTLALNGGLVLANASGNTLTISGAPTLGSSSSITVNSGTLALTNNTANSANVSGSPTASVAIGATLQLAGSSNVLSSAVNITTHGSGLASDGALTVVGASTQTVGVVTGDALTGDVTTYSGNTTVGDGTNAANLTATQILQNTLTINAGSTVTIAPSGSGIPADAQGPEAVSGVALAAGSSDSDSDSSSDPFTAIQAAIASGAISSAKGQQLENRIAAIERLAATDPGLDASLLEDRVLAAIPSSSVWTSGASPLSETGSGLLAVDSSTIGSSFGSSFGGASAAFAPSADFAGGPELAEGAAVPEPSTLLLAALGGFGILIACRRRTICGK